MDDNTIRLLLHSKLVAAFPDLVIYYQPSGNVPLDRPCITYEPKRDEPTFADNDLYTMGRRFQVTLLSDLPGYNKRPMYGISGIVIVNQVSYTSSDIVHDVFNISVNSIT
jgi:hypothetical protein